MSLLRDIPKRVQQEELAISHRNNNQDCQKGSDILGFWAFPQFQ